MHYHEHSSVLPPETAARAAGDEEDEEDGEEAVDDQLERLLQSRVTPRVPATCPHLHAHVVGAVLVRVGDVLLGAVRQRVAGEPLVDAEEGRVRQPRVAVPPVRVPAG